MPSNPCRVGCCDTNKYVELFADKFNVPVLGRDANMTSAHAEGITTYLFCVEKHNFDVFHIDYIKCA